LFFGRIEKNSGAKKAIEIAKRIRMKLIITGSVYDQVFFENDVQPHVDGNRIKYVTIDEIKKIDDLFGGAYALLYPEKCDASYILPAIESMACGTPVITLNYGSIPELIVEGKTGFLISDAEEAVDAISRIPLINRRECRKHVEEHFTAARMVDDYRAVYERIVRQTTREEHRPWGYYKVLADETDYKIKQIVVYPGKRLSLQRHKHRTEHWYIVEGEAIVTRNDEEIYLKKGQYVDIPLTALHRIQNNGAENMAFIEVQTGDYFGEDDIERMEDDFGRL